MSSLTHLAALGGDSRERQCTGWESQTIVARQTRELSNEIITVVVEGGGED